MTTTIFLSVLVGALLHASWNSTIKVRLDRTVTMLLLALFQCAIALPLLTFVDAPSTDAIWWIVAAAFLHAGYKIFLIQAYTHADLSQAYPLARGLAPMIVTVFSMLSLGESFCIQQLAAISLISAGILLMAAKGSPHGRMTGKALFFALGTAAFTASYTLVDGMGARIAQTAIGFLLWMAIGDAIVMAAWAYLVRGNTLFKALGPEWKIGLATGAMSLASYGIAMWAFTQAPLALIAALRESSILFAVLISAWVLREHVTIWRWMSALSIACGIILMKI